jgi:hypothetical protein
MMIEASDVSIALDRFLKNIALDHTAHVAAKDGPEVMAECEALAADVQEFRDSIIARAAVRRDRRVKNRKHAEILPKCAEARERFEKLERELEPTNNAYLAADNSYTNAQHRLAHHLENPLRPESYPNAKAIREWNLEKHRLERAAEERRLELLARVNERNHTHSEYRRVKAEFDALSFQERQLRPPTQAPRVIATSWRVQEAPELTPIGPNR